MDLVIKDIIIRFLEHRISREEMAVLDVWMQQPGHKSVFKDFVGAWLVGRGRGENFSATRAFQHFLMVQQRKERRRIYLRRTKYAAMVMILLGGTLGWWLGHRSTYETEIVKTASELRPLGKNAILTLENGKTLALSEADSSCGLVTSMDSSLQYAGNRMVYRPGGTEEKPVFHRLETPAGAEFQLTLSDGSKVWLNNLSRLRYPVKFSSRERMVYLEGEAYFEVARNENSPFRIVTERSVLNVLGTSFNVSAYRSDGRQEITLVSGKLQVETDRHTVVLQPGEQAVMDEGQAIQVNEVDTFIYTAWREGKFYFNNEPLGKVLQRLSQWYRFEYRFTDEQLKQERLMCIVDKYDDFDTIIRLIQKTRCAELVYESGMIVVKPFVNK